MRPEYHFRAEKKADAEAWLKVMHEHGCSESVPAVAEESTSGAAEASSEAEDSAEAPAST